MPKHENEVFLEDRKHNRRLPPTTQAGKVENGHGLEPGLQRDSHLAPNPQGNPFPDPGTAVSAASNFTCPRSRNAPPDGIDSWRIIGTIVRMRVVADTNTFLAVALDEPEREAILRVTAGYDLVAPNVLPFEVGNALSAMMKKGTIEANDALAAWDAVQLVPVELRGVDIRSAIGIAAAQNLYAYDAYFLECSLRLRCPLLTLDSRLRTAAEAMNLHVLEVQAE